MPQDAFTLNYICKELNGVFKGGTVNRIVQPDTERVVFTIYTGNKTQKLLISVNPSSPRIGLTEDEGGLLTAPNFCMLLKKHLSSSKILNIELVPFDRIVKIDFLTSVEFTEPKTLTLYTELMGRYSNIILTENGKILGSNRGGFDNGVRPLITGRSYEFPPVNKFSPKSEELKSELKGDITAEILIDKVSGLSLSTANEIINSFSGGDFYKHLNDFIFNAKKRPCVVYKNGEIKEFCVFPYSGDKEIKECNSLLIAEKLYSEEKENFKILSQKRDKLSSIINNAIKKAKKKLNLILLKEKDAENLEENRIKGELIVSNIYKIKRGDKICELDNYYDGTKIQISLDERLSPADNAQVYFKKYNKQKRTLVSIAPQKSELEKELDYLSSVLEEITLAESVSELDIIKEELISSRLMNPENNKKKKDDVTIGKTYEYSGYRVRVGRNNSENDKITFTAKEKDMWLHVKDYHSAHVIIERKKDEIPEKVIIFAAELAVFYSKARDGGKVDVVFTERRNVKKPPKSHLGFVTYTDFKSVLVSSNAHSESLIIR